jgi:hypothetical protein
MEQRTDWSLVNPDALQNALEAHGVTLRFEGARDLSQLLGRTVRAYAQRVGPDHLDDFIGVGAAAWLEPAAADARELLAATVQLAKLRFDAPAMIGEDYDPVAAAAADFYLPEGASPDDASELAAAARRVGDAAKRALQSVSASDLQTLASATAMTTPGRPARLGLNRAVVRAVYHFWEQQGREMALASADARSPTSELARAAHATLSAMGLATESATIRQTVGHFKDQLRNSEMKGDKSCRASAEEDILGSVPDQYSAAELEKLFGENGTN